jgi:phosphoribosylamine--glycine ligase/phosphoribosylformylglycinamidine cyclo-ligase
LFRLVRAVATQLDTHELYRTLNMGVGMVVVCAADDIAAVQQVIDEPTWVIGELVPTSNSSSGTDRRVHLR